ncbi:MAG: hypothetical protein J2P57_03300 [Acidimicrobiaceae bacterium]|nr:hypothetical protein [Acidimicrobiaceae bacterium]
MTYGDHQEATSGALLRLLDLTARDYTVELTMDPAESSAVLAVRHQIHLALEERLSMLGARPQERHRTDTTVSAAKHPVHVLRSVLDGLPRPPDVDRAPCDVLGPSPDGAAEAVGQWRTVAKHLTLGNADLAASVIGLPEQRPASWYLLGDISLTLEGLVVLDDSLANQGLLPRDSDAYVLARLAAGGVTRVATWRGTDSRLDFALAPTTETSFADDGPRVRLVRRPEDFAAAQRALAGFMRPRPVEDTEHPLDERPGLHAARVIAEGQVRLADVFAAWAERAGERTLAERFRGRIQKYIELHRSTLRMTELQATRPVLVDLQQSEMIQQLCTHRTSTLSRISLYDLDAATGDLAVNVGKSLRREGLRRRNILVLDTSSDGLPQARPITCTRNRFNLACRALASEATLKPNTGSTLRRQRTELARTLSR